VLFRFQDNQVIVPPHLTKKYYRVLREHSMMLHTRLGGSLLGREKKILVALRVRNYCNTFVALAALCCHEKCLCSERLKNYINSINLMCGLTLLCTHRSSWWSLFTLSSARCF